MGEDHIDAGSFTAGLKFLGYDRTARTGKQTQGRPCRVTKPTLNEIQSPDWQAWNRSRTISNSVWNWNKE